MKYTSEDMNKPVNENETLLQFIRNSEKEFGMNVACLGSMTDKEFNNYIDFLDDLWCKRYFWGGIINELCNLQKGNR